ncbi:MAG: hypothetical protein DMF28_01040 [Verrucomicrobia bacterium]|nr:MAG: hypothetical protein DMF28_01040 [Verrucomicrobiota bacterium]
MTPPPLNRLNQITDKPRITRRESGARASRYDELFDFGSSRRRDTFANTPDECSEFILTEKIEISPSGAA